MPNPEIPTYKELLPTRDFLSAIRETFRHMREDPKHVYGLRRAEWLTGHWLAVWPGIAGSDPFPALPADFFYTARPDQPWPPAITYMMGGEACPQRNVERQRRPDWVPTPLDLLSDDYVVIVFEPSDVA